MGKFLLGCSGCIYPDTAVSGKSVCKVYRLVDQSPFAACLLPTLVNLLTRFFSQPCFQPLLVGIIEGGGRSGFNSGYDAKITFRDSSAFIIGLCFGLSSGGRLIIFL